MRRIALVVLTFCLACETETPEPELSLAQKVEGKYTVSRVGSEELGSFTSLPYTDNGNTYSAEITVSVIDANTVSILHEAKIQKPEGLEVNPISIPSMGLSEVDGTISAYV